MKRMLKKAQLLATNDFSTQNNGVKLFTKDKHGVAILAYDQIINDGEKDIVATTKEIYDFARENKIMLLTRSGQEYGFLNDSGTTDTEIQWCNQPENCDDWCNLVQAKKQSFSDAGHGRD